MNSNLQYCSFYSYNRAIHRRQETFMPHAESYCCVTQIHGLSRLIRITWSIENSLLFHPYGLAKVRPSL